MFFFHCLSRLRDEMNSMICRWADFSFHRRSDDCMSKLVVPKALIGTLLSYYSKSNKSSFFILKNLKRIFFTTVLVFLLFPISCRLNECKKILLSLYLLYESHNRLYEIIKERSMLLFDSVPWRAQHWAIYHRYGQKLSLSKIKKCISRHNIILTNVFLFFNVYGM